MPCHVYSVFVPPFNQNAAVDRGHMFISAMHHTHQLLKCLCCLGEDAAGAAAAAQPQKDRSVLAVASRLVHGSGLRCHGQRLYGPAGLRRQEGDPPARSRLCSQVACAAATAAQSAGAGTDGTDGTGQGPSGQGHAVAEAAAVCGARPRSGGGGGGRCGRGGAAPAATAARLRRPPPAPRLAGLEAPML